MKTFLQNHTQFKHHPSCKNSNSKTQATPLLPHCKTNPKKPKFSNQSNKTAPVIKQYIQADSPIKFQSKSQSDPSRVNIIKGCKPDVPPRS